MLRNNFQSGFLSLLYASGTHPLQMWSEKGTVSVVRDEDIQAQVVEVVGENISESFIACPPSKTLGIKLPLFVLNVKNMNRYFSFEIEIMDDKKYRRRFRASNYQTEARIKPYICTLPMRLSEGWNQVQLNLAELTRKVYGSGYVETLRVQIHANCRLRRVYFADKVCSEEELPVEFKLYLPKQEK